MIHDTVINEDLLSHKTYRVQICTGKTAKIVLLSEILVIFVQTSLFTSLQHGMLLKWSSKNHLAENDWRGPAVTEFRGSHGMEEGKGKRYLASGHQYSNALLGVRHQEEEVLLKPPNVIWMTQCKHHM